MSEEPEGQTFAEHAEAGSREALGDVSTWPRLSPMGDGEYVLRDEPDLSGGTLTIVRPTVEGLATFTRTGFFGDVTPIGLIPWDQLPR